nr:probable magnesium transporter NIPA1 [Tanacetum cinerariifolium]
MRLQLVQSDKYGTSQLSQVMCVKAVAIAIKLSFSGSNQFVYFQTWFFTQLLAIFCVMQIHYLNKALDTFNTNVISPWTSGGNVGWLGTLGQNSGHFGKSSDFRRDSKFCSIRLCSSHSRDPIGSLKYNSQ